MAQPTVYRWLLQGPYGCTAPPSPGPRRGPAHAVLHRLPPPAGHRGHVAAGGGEPEALAPHAQVLLVSQVSLGQDGGRVARCQVTAAASPAQRMGASPLPPVDGTSGRLAGEKSSVPEPALLLSGRPHLSRSCLVSAVRRLH